MTGPTRTARTIPPLDSAALERLALRYVERFATTRGKLADYLRRKIRERGWDGPAADPQELAERMVTLGYVDDRAFAEARAVSLTRRGLGAGRVTAALRQARVGEADAAAVRPVMIRSTIDSALTMARKRRFGPFALTVADRPLQEKQIAAMVRAGHSFGLSRRIVTTAPDAVVDFDGVMPTEYCEIDEPC
ncbi:regulatory protein RecX [Sphingomonas mollis]|uniref:RecX family transcriptional regulator n=1 Tax=Sphingomonas mollis TaxID=2795726 RepID=A0ABS0XLC6_9SPHN|nr:RecX family transcriptional regulator [Sphingomonas sp. BT553]MBJ6120615.1 RecX family transcriptional regulator [Sphingomonas sp. BT553]